MSIGKILLFVVPAIMCHAAHATYFDRETGTLYNYFRDYDAQVGRYIQSDPIGLVAGLNTYTYVSGKPLTSIDLFGLSEITYNNATRTLIVTDRDGNRQSFPAGNNAQRGSRGSWEEGVYNYAYDTRHPDDTPNSAYGSSGNIVFRVPGCTGCGVHSGRAASTDRAGRSGPEYATNGCIRTTDEAMSLIRRLQNAGDPVRSLTVERGNTPVPAPTRNTTPNQPPVPAQAPTPR